MRAQKQNLNKNIYFMKRNLLTLISSLTLLLCATSSVFAQDKNPPENMTFQGFLTDEQGVAYGSSTPVNETVIFKIYKSPTDTNALWGESQIVTIDNGHFSVLLGLGSTVGPRPPLYSIFSGPDASDRWMEITVGGNVISPRIQFFAAPYAQLARVANELAPGTGAINAGAITSTGAITGTSLALGGGAINAGAITGTSLALGGGAINAGAIKGAALTGTSLALGGGAINAGAITTTGAINAGAITSKVVKTAGAGSRLGFENNDNNNVTYTWYWSATAQNTRHTISELKVDGAGPDYAYCYIHAHLRAASYQDLSDARIKKVHGVSNGAQDLDLLRGIKIQDYELIDSEIKGKMHKKVVAQQVKEIYPQAVSTGVTPSLIPDIYAEASGVSYDPIHSELQITMDRPHGLSVGDMVDLRANDSRMREKVVLKTTNDHTFTVSCEKSQDKVFVIGKYVNDLLSVEYNAIAMLNVSATQELARQADDLKSRVRDLEARERRVALLEESLEAKMSRIKTFEERLDAFEKRLVGVSPQIDRSREDLQVSVISSSSR
jgi:regulator of RNase E activity RraB